MTSGALHGRTGAHRAGSAPGQGAGPFRARAQAPGKPGRARRHATTCTRDRPSARRGFGRARTSPALSC
eukprot:10661735-Lingulodinium_polyedra.AAC.1